MSLDKEPQGHKTPVDRWKSPESVEEVSLDDDDDDDFAFPNKFEDVSEAELYKERKQDWLSEYNVDDESLVDLLPLEKIKIAINLFEEFERSREKYSDSDRWSTDDNPRNTPESDRVRILHRRAKEIIASALENKEVSLVDIISCINTNSANGIDQLYGLDEAVWDMVVKDSTNQDGLIEASKLYSTKLQSDYLQTLESLEQSLENKSEANYFLYAFLPGVRDRWSGKSLADDMYGFYEIEQGRLAVVNYDSVKFATTNQEGAAEILDLIRETNQILLDDPDAYLDATLDHLEDLSDDMGDWRGINLLHSAEFSDIDPKIIANYVRMLQSETRSVIERDFGIQLNILSIREQLYLLDYLQHVGIGEVKTMQTFISAYGTDAMRAFLANAYDENASENIMIFGTMIEHDVASKMFSAYAGSIDSTNSLSKQLETDQENSSLNTLMSEFNQGMLKRASHLFDAGKQMSLSEYGGEEETADLISAYEGVSKILSVLSGINEGASYAVTEIKKEVGGDASMQTTKFNLTENETGYLYKLKVSIRPEASTQGEARINFELSLDGLPEENELRKAFQQTTQFKGKNGKNARTVTGSVIRFGFDLDTRTNPPTFSFDMGRGAYTSDDMERTGDVLGRILSEVAPTGHHLQDFDASLSNPENFKKVAEAFSRHFENISTI